MNIVSISDGHPMTTSVAIAEGVGNPHKSVIQLVRQNLSDLEEFGPIAFQMRKGEALPQGGFGRSTEYALLNERQATLLMTYMRNNDVVREFKKRLVKAFYEFAAPQVPQSMPEALRLAAEAIEQKQKLEQENHQLEATIGRIAKADGSFCVRDAAKDLQVRPIDLTRWLMAHKWAYRRQGNTTLIAYQDKIQSGHMEHKVTIIPLDDGTERVSQQARITSKGLAKLSELFTREA